MSGGGGGGAAYASPWSSQSGLNELDSTLQDLEPLGALAEAGFEPQIRARSNTWPLPRPENYVEPGDDPASKKNSNTNLPSTGAPPLPSPASAAGKKNSSRRNAWGNLSYADLITQAITSAPDTRLTLAQIYEWMVQNVPYFKDKGDSNSSAGWKNSIRHNLSLHNRFMRVQNEGTGKSSWWMINPDAKPGKSVRRRAASMETSKFEKKRGRVKKKVENIRNGMPADASPSPSSSVSEGFDTFPESPMHSTGFQLSPQEYRQRTASNASSISRRSPVPALLQPEPEWGQDYDFAPEYPTEYTPDYVQAEQLAGNLADTMKLQHPNDPFLGTCVTSSSSGPVGYPYAYTCPSHPPGGCLCASLSPAYSAHPHHLDQFARPSQPNDSADMHGSTMQVSTQDTHLLNGGLMVSHHNMTPTTVMGQLMGALNTTIVEDLNLNIETLEHGGFDCNVDEVIKHELSMDGSLDFNFPQQQQCIAGEFAVPAQPSPAPPPPAPHTQQPHSRFTSPSWVH